MAGREFTEKKKDTLWFVFDNKKNSLRKK